jgi:hypothetical protein
LDRKIEITVVIVLLMVVAVAAQAALNHWKPEGMMGTLLARIAVIASTVAIGLALIFLAQLTARSVLGAP